MKLIRFSFEDKANKWRLEEMHFNRLTLLVGASGVGKTRILLAIELLKRIALGESPNGVIWNIELELKNGKNYIWEGEFEKLDTFTISENNGSANGVKPKLKYEKITLIELVENNIVRQNSIAERIQDEITYNAQDIIKLSRENSLLFHLREEPEIKEIYLEINKIYGVDHSSVQLLPKFFDVSMEYFETDINTLDKIQNSGFGIRKKLLLCSKNDKKTFKKIKARFIEIFPQVEDVKVDFLDEDDEDYNYASMKYFYIQIKESRVSKWINSYRVSSGMQRTLFQIAELYLMPEGTIFLIDEFENSLGINCLNDLVDDILFSERQLQFVMTSHHPYIINNINYKNWKLITRKGSVVTAHDISEFDFGKSKHEAFMQLIQLEQFQTGMAIV